MFFGWSQKVAISAEKKAALKKVDDAVTAVVKKSDKVLASYLRARFSLQQGQFPHQLKF